jgi:hypothetical protein
MDPGEILRDTARLYRAHWRPLVTIAAAVYVPVAAVAALVGGTWPGFVVATLLNVAAIFLVQGAVTVAVARIREGAEEIDLSATLARAAERLLPLTVAGVLATLGIVLGMLALVVPGLVLLTWWVVVSPVIVLEDPAVGPAFGRSRRLVHGHAWPAFGVVVLTLVALLALNVALALALSPLHPAAAAFLTTVIGSTLAAPFAGVAWTLTYFRLRALQPGYTHAP